VKADGLGERPVHFVERFLRADGVRAEPVNDGRLVGLIGSL
jgi:hypothetical protein